MAEESVSFERNMQTSGKLHQMLGLFTVTNMSGDIKQNIQSFLKFCRKQREFTHRLFTIALNSGYQDLDDDKTKRVAQHTVDVLTNDEDSLSQFLFGRKQTLHNNSGISEHVEQQAIATIESEAERLFSDSPRDKKEAQWQKLPDAFTKYELVELSLAHLKQPHKNETCLGFINKLYSSLLRRQGNLFLQFLQDRPEYLGLLIQNIHYCSIANMLAVMLSCEDKTGEYRFEGLKMQIFQRILEQGLNSIEDPLYFDGFMTAAEEIFNSTKQSYYEYFEDFKRCANILVSETTLRKFYSKLTSSEVAFTNASVYLELILRRINSEKQEQDYYKQNGNTDPSMKFEHDFFINEIDNLFELIDKTSHYASTSRISYLSFLLNLVKNLKENKAPLPSVQLFQKLFAYYLKETSSGLIKNYLFQLLKLILSKMEEPELADISIWLLEYNAEYAKVNTLLGQELCQRNKEQSSCFLFSLLFELQSKKPNFLEEYDAKNKIVLGDMYIKYKSKLANYGQESEPMSPVICDQDEQVIRSFTSENYSAFIQPAEDTGDKKPKQETQTVGKNNVVIPVLNLPSKINNPKITIEQEVVEQVKIPEQLSREDLIRDLKNTRFELPAKFKIKKIEQPQPTSTTTEVNQALPEPRLAQQTKKQNQVNLRLQIVQQLKEAKKPLESIENSLKLAVGSQVPVVGSSIVKEEQRYFVKHVMLF